MAKQPNRKPSKVYDVPIGKMRVPPALVTQREFRKAHGDRIAADLDLNKIGLPVLALTRGGGKVWKLSLPTHRP